MSSPPAEPLILPADEVAVEKLARGGIVTLFSGIAGLPNVVGEATYIEGEAEYVRQFGFDNPSSKKKEYRLLEIIFGDFNDLPLGCEDRPSYQLIYTINLLIQFSALAKANGGSTSSTDDFARIVLTLRRRVLDAKKDGLAGYKQLHPENLKPAAPARFGADDDLGLRAAHFAQFLLAVEVTPSPLASN